MNTSKLTLELSIEEANMVLQALGKMPFEQVFPLIHKIQGQAKEQVETSQNGTGNGLKPAEAMTEV